MSEGTTSANDNGATGEDHGNPQGITEPLNNSTASYARNGTVTGDVISQWERDKTQVIKRVLNMIEHYTSRAQVYQENMETISNKAIDKIVDKLITYISFLEDEAVFEEDNDPMKESMDNLADRLCALYDEYQSIQSEITLRNKEWEPPLSSSETIASQSLRQSQGPHGHDRFVNVRSRAREHRVENTVNSVAGRMSQNTTASYTIPNSVRMSTRVTQGSSTSQNERTPV